MRSQDHKIELLHATPLFADLNKRQLREVARLADEVHVEAGKVLMHEGELGAEMLIVLSGSAKVTQGRRRLGDVGPGDTVGEIALIDSGPRTATVVASEPMELLVIPGQGFDKLKKAVPGLTEALLKATVRRLRASGAVIAG